MSAVTIDQLNPANGDMTDGRRVLLSDGSVASIARVAHGLLVIHAGSEFGPFASEWRVMDELCRLDSEASASPKAVEPEVSHVQA